MKDPTEAEAEAADAFGSRIQTLISYSIFQPNTG